MDPKLEAVTAEYQRRLAALRQQQLDPSAVSNPGSRVNTPEVATSMVAATPGVPLPDAGVPKGFGIDPSDEFGKALAGQPAVVSTPRVTIQPTLDRMNAGEFVAPQGMPSIAPPEPQAEPRAASAQPAQPSPLNQEQMEVAAHLEQAKGPGGKPSRSKLLATGMFMEMPDGKLRYRKPASGQPEQAPQAAQPLTRVPTPVVPTAVPGIPLYRAGAKAPTPTAADKPPVTRNIAGVDYTEQPTNMVDPVTGRKFIPTNEPKSADAVKAEVDQKKAADNEVRKKDLASKSIGFLKTANTFFNKIPEGEGNLDIYGRKAKEKFLPASPEAQFKGAIDTMTSEEALSTIQRVREASPTGAALGNSSDRDVQLFKDTAGSFDLKANKWVIKNNLDRLAAKYADVIHGTDAAIDNLVATGKITADVASKAKSDKVALIKDAQAGFEPPKKSATEAFGLKIPPVK